MSDTPGGMRAQADTGGPDRAEVARHASSLLDRALAQVGEGAEAAKDKAADIAEAGKAGGVRQIGAVADAVRRAADEMGQRMPHTAGYMQQAADTIEGAATALNKRSVEDLVGGFAQFARAQPGVVFAAGVLAGFAMSRFLKSSAADEQVAHTSGG